MKVTKPFSHKINNLNKRTILNSVEIVEAGHTPENVSCNREKNRCNKMNYYARMCNAKSEKLLTRQATIQLTSHGPRKHKFRDKPQPIYSVSNRQPNRRRNRTNYSNEINIIVMGISWIALLDSGPCRSCIIEEFVDKCKIDIAKLEGNNVEFLRAGNGQALKIEGQPEVPVKLNGLTTTYTC